MQDDPRLADEDPFGYFLSPDDLLPRSGAFSALSAPRGVVVLLHGYDLTGNHDPGVDFRPACDYVKAQLEPRGYVVWAMRYDTHSAFRWGGVNCAHHLRSSGLPLNNVHLFGYSMGGLVARTMVAEGIPAATIYTYATPNEGTGWWVPNLLGNLLGDNHGALSMMGQSADLRWLNQDSPEVQHRERLIAVGFRHQGAWGDAHQNDGMAEIHSQCMQQVAQVKPGLGLMWGWPKAVNKHNPLENAFQPHRDAQKLPYAQAALDHFIRVVQERGG